MALFMISQIFTNLHAPHDMRCTIETHMQILVYVSYEKILLIINQPACRQSWQHVLRYQEWTTCKQARLI